MKYVGKILGVGLLASASLANAGFNGNTAHSRANCFGFNESVTWNWNEYHLWEVRSFHDRLQGSRESKPSHNVLYLMNLTWRAAAYDVSDVNGEFGADYFVRGYHFYMDDYGKKIYDAYTEAHDCSAYDGWWDWDK